MEYGYKPTTNGRALLTACAATEKPLKLTRVAVGSGTVPEGTNLADVHELVDYVADGTISERRHEDDRLYLTIQYANISNPDVKTFALSEFIVYAQHPETGEETDILYATLGDYKQPVPAYSQSFPACVFNFPLVLVLSDEIEVSIGAPAGLVTYEDFAETVETVREELLELVEPYAANEISYTVPSDGWTQIQDADGNSRYYYDIPCEEAAADGKTDVSVDEAYQEAAAQAGLSETADVHPGYIRIWSETNPDTEIAVSCSLLSEELQNAIAGQLEAHNADSNAHSTVISNAVRTAVTNLLASDDPDNPVAAAVETAIQGMLESGEVVGKETVKNMINTAGASGGGYSYSGCVTIVIPADGWTLMDEPIDGYNYICDVAVDSVTEDQMPIGGPVIGSSSVAQAAGMANGCETMDGHIRFYAARVPTADITATIALFVQGGTSDIATGNGLTTSDDGKLTLALGAGLTFDGSGRVAVDTASVDETADAISSVFDNA